MSNNINMRKIIVKTGKLLLYVFIIFLLVFVALFCLFNFGFLTNFSETKFDRNKLATTPNQVVILDSKDNIISPDYIRSSVDIKAIPKQTIDAFTSIEDKTFYKHGGINYKRIVKAMINNTLSGQFREGASTISQQVIKNTHLSNEKTIKRKLSEMILTKEMEKTLTKDEIMSAYLSAIYFGGGAFGINSASQRFYSKSPSSLNLNESATLAGIIKSPKLYSPISHEESCLKRRNIVLKEMLKDEKITKNEYDQTISKGLELHLDNDCINQNNYYRAVIDEACDVLHIQEKDLVIGKYKISTYLDPSLQSVCLDAVKNAKSITNSNDIDSAVLVIDNQTGGIKAFCGRSLYNLLEIKRQPGSIFKPIISYGPAIEDNLIYPITKILDEKTSFDSYTPHNYKDVYHGYVSAKEALAKSYNIPSVKLLQTVGIDRAKDFASNMSIDFSSQDKGLSLAVGAMTEGVDIKSITNAYQAIANNGQMINARFIKQIESSNGKILYKNLQTKKQVMKDSTAFLLSDMLREGVLSGTSKALNIKNQYICAKTGTVASSFDKNENSDVWSMSYSGENTVCCWLGATGQKQISKSVTGSSGATILAKKVYEKCDLALKKNEIPSSVEPLYISEMEYNINNRIVLSSKDTPDRYKMRAYFAKDNEPTLQSNMFDELPPLTLEAERINNKSVLLKFDAQKHLKYKLYRIIEDENQVILEVNNKNEKINFEDSNLKQDTLYTYFLEGEYLNSDIISCKEKRESNRIKMYLSSNR